MAGPRDSPSRSLRVLTVLGLRRVVFVEAGHHLAGESDRKQTEHDQRQRAIPEPIGSSLGWLICAMRRFDRRELEVIA